MKRSVIRRLACLGLSDSARRRRRVFDVRNILKVVGIGGLDLGAFDQRNIAIAQRLDRDCSSVGSHRVLEEPLRHQVGRAATGMGDFNRLLDCLFSYSLKFF